MWRTAYLILTGAGIASDVGPPLIAGLAERFERVLTLPTPNADRVVNRRDLSRLPGHTLVESYFDQAILPRPEHGLTLIAPCSFNSLTSLAGGLAPNLALSVAAEAIGRRTPVVVAIACNADLWRHPQAQAAAITLRQWGCAVIDPAPTASATGIGLAPVKAILAAVDAARER